MGMLWHHLRMHKVTACEQQWFHRNMHVLSIN